jgi:hypothetical protein
MLRDPLATHQVTNQPPPLTDYDVFGADRTLRASVEREGAGWALDELHELGRLAGSAPAQAWGEQANANPPMLRSHDRYGNRIDRVEYHRVPRGAGGGRPRLRGPWADDRPAPTWHAAKVIVRGRRRPHLPDLDDHSAMPKPTATRGGGRVGAGLVSRTYDRAFAPASAKASLTCGMAMTERGGSDVEPTPRRHGDQRRARGITCSRVTSGSARPRWATPLLMLAQRRAQLLPRPRWIPRSVYSASSAKTSWRPLERRRDRARHAPGPA